MLRKSGRGGLLVLDEATSSVDAEMNVLIQRLVREEFHSYTVVAVAYQFETTIDLNVIVVMARRGRG